MDRHMNTLQADRVVKAIVDGVHDYTEIAERAGIDPGVLVEYEPVVDRAIQLMRGFYKYGHENMKPAGLPPPLNPFFDRGKGIEEQSPEYFAFEAVQRNNMDRERCIQTCLQLGLNRADAERALENVCMPWREENGWRSYACQGADGHYMLQDKAPVKLKRHLERLLSELVDQ